MRLSSVLLTLFLCLPLIIYAEPVKYPDFDVSEALYLYHTEDQYFKKGIKNKALTETECLAYIIYEEARGESDEGQIAVGFVVKNRAEQWNKTLCQVARQPGEFETRITKLYGPTDKDTWWHALNIAFFLNERSGYATVSSPVGDAIYFNSLSAAEQSIMGRRRSDRYRGKIGHHYFYGAKKIS